MNNKKTGALIAKRRQELGMTQKELGERLHVSDRAVSKWERAAGFPDVSLLEPLADTLNLSVLELIRGERLAAEECPSPETERSVRTAIRELGGRLWRSLVRFRRIIVVLVILLAAGASFIAYRLFSPFRSYYVYEREVSAAEALEAAPHAIITADDFAAVQRMLEDPQVGGLRVPYPDGDGHLPPDWKDHYITVDDEVVAPYRELLRIEGQAADGISVSVDYDNIIVEYSRASRRCTMQILYNGSIYKVACTYDDREDTHGPVDGIVVTNMNNEHFTIVWKERDLLNDLLRAR